MQKPVIEGARLFVLRVDVQGAAETGQGGGAVLFCFEHQRLVIVDGGWVHAELQRPLQVGERFVVALLLMAQNPALDDGRPKLRIELQGMIVVGERLVVLSEGGIGPSSVVETAGDRRERCAAFVFRSRAHANAESLDRVSEVLQPVGAVAPIVVRPQAGRL